ncbi:MAG: MFS family permease [Yoonia sp.]|jgi:MFS family permease
MNQKLAKYAVLMCMIVFFAQPIHLGLWLSRVAEVQSTLGLTKAQLAIALLGMPTGLLPSLYFAGRTVGKLGPRRALLIAFVPMLLAGILPSLATGTASLLLALFIFGAVLPFAQVSLNVFAAQVEKKFNIKIMNRAHGFWSLGIMAGSLVGVQLASVGVTAAPSLFIAAVVLMPLLIMVAYALPDMKPARPEATTSDALPPIPNAVWLIAAVIFGATLVEGAMIDWATVYMREIAGAIAGSEGLAVTVFSGFVTIGRFMGDTLNNRFGTVFLVRLCLGSAISGLLILIAGFGGTSAFLGFALVGFGVSTIFPLGVSATAALSDKGEARNVSVMTFGALSGFLIGPPMIGFFADTFSLSAAFILLVPGLVFSFKFAKRLSSNGHLGR